MPATQTKPFQTLSQDFYDEFNNELEERSIIPWAQVVNAPNLELADIEKLEKPWGIFISAENAESVEFTPDKNWSKTQVSFGSDPVNGFLSRHIRLCVIHRSNLEVQEKQVDSSWRYIGLAYQKGGRTELGELARSDENYRTTTRNLVIFLGENNEPLHGAPVQLTTRGAFGASFGIDLKRYYEQAETVFWKAQGKPVKPISALGHGRMVYDVELALYKGNKNPSIYVAKRMAAALKEVGKTKTIDDGAGRSLTLSGVPLDSLLASSKTQLGKQIIDWQQEYEAFPKPRDIAKQNNESAPDSWQLWQEWFGKALAEQPPEGWDSVRGEIWAQARTPDQKSWVENFYQDFLRNHSASEF